MLLLVYSMQTGALQVWVVHCTLCGRKTLVRSTVLRKRSQTLNASSYFETHGVLACFWREGDGTQDAVGAAARQVRGYAAPCGHQRFDAYIMRILLCGACQCI